MGQRYSISSLTLRMCSLFCVQYGLPGATEKNRSWISPLALFCVPVCDVAVSNSGLRHYSELFQVDYSLLFEIVTGVAVVGD